MKTSFKHNQFAKSTTKTVTTAVGMTGVGIGAHYVKELVSDTTNNNVLGLAAGITTILVGAVVVTIINNEVDKAFDVKALSASQSLLIDEFDNLGHVEGVKF